MTGVIEPFPYQNQQFQPNEKLLYDIKIIGMSLLIDGQREKVSDLSLSCLADGATTIGWLSYDGQSRTSIVTQRS